MCTIYVYDYSTCIINLNGTTVNLNALTAISRQVTVDCTVIQYYYYLLLVLYKIKSQYMRACNHHAISYGKCAATSHAHAYAHVHGACAWACGMDMRMYVPCTLARHMRQEQVSKALLNLLQRRRPDCASHQRRSRSSRL